MAKKTMEELTLRFCGTLSRKMFVVFMDVHSEWPEIIEVTSVTAQRTIVEDRRLFSTFGLPEQVVTDNGPTFVAREF